MMTSLRAALMIGLVLEALGLTTGCAEVSPDQVDTTPIATVEQPLRTAPKFEVGWLTVEKGYWHHFGPFRIVGPYGTSRPTFSARMSPLASDVDLYMRKGARPTRTEYDCRPYSSGTTVEECDSIGEESGDFYVSVHGYAAGRYWLRVSDTGNMGIFGDFALQNQHVAQGDWHFYGPFYLYDGEVSEAWLKPLSGDPDLYGSDVPSNETYYYGAYVPTLSQYNCRPYSGGVTEEACLTVAPSGQIVGVHGYRDSTYSIEIAAL